MGRLSSAIDWWDEWKLRILILCSMSVQLFLFLAVYRRRWYVLRWLRVIVWLAYIGGDTLPVYALATLFNRQKQQQTTADGRGGGSSALEVIWAPVLLIHLGGQPGITAYSLEDNELWKRHAITLVSQVTVALYVFCKWWSGETRLLQATVLLFIAGILKFGQKPWALRGASYGSITSTSVGFPSELESSSRWRHQLGKCFSVFCTCTNFLDIQAQFEEQQREEVGEDRINYSLEGYVYKAKKNVKEGRKESDEAQQEKFMKAQALVSKDMYKMLLDLAAPYSVRLHYLQSFLNLDGENQHKMLRRWIGSPFGAIYTKYRSTVTCLGISSFYVLPSLPLASAVLFTRINKDGYDKSDITVTYILFFGAVVMELAPFFEWLCQILFRCNNEQIFQVLGWPDMVSQHNIMSFCARKKKPLTLMKLATFSYLRDYINKNWYISHQYAAQQISMLVRQHAEDGWKEYIRDAATYRRFNNLRGEHTLMNMGHHLLDLEQGKLRWTFNLPFDEYVLLWHLATDLCIHQTTDDDASQASIISSRRSSEITSNYMIYLLSICPEMLIPGARQDLFIHACDDIEGMIKHQPQASPSLDERSIAERIFCCMEQDGERMKEYSM